VLAIDYLYGIGYASQATLLPSTINTLARANETTPGALAADIAGNIYLADSGSNLVLKITSGGATSIVAGSRTASTSSQTACGGGATATSVKITPAGVAVDGAAATTAELDAPNSVASDTAGDIYFNDTGNNRVRVVALATGDISTAVGGGTEVPAQNPVPAANAALDSPSGFTVDSQGNLYIADTGAGVVKKIAAVSSTLRYPKATATGSIDTTDGAQTVTLLNTGNQTLTHVSPGLAEPADFVQVTEGNNCTTSFSLTQEASCNISIEFDPENVGTLDESFTVTDNALG